MQLRLMIHSVYLVLHNSDCKLTEQTLTGTYGADGAFRLTGGAGIGKNLAVGGAKNVYGATELNWCSSDLVITADILVLW